MKYRILNSADIDKIVRTQIIEGINLNDFLSQHEDYKDILACPTHAIDYTTKCINQDCIDCGICWIKNRQFIEKTDKDSDYIKFHEYISDNKMYIYRWLSLALSDYSAIEINAKGHSRSKRIPLIIKSGKDLYFFKALNSILDLDQGIFEMEDSILSNVEVLSKYSLLKVIIILEDHNLEIKSKALILKLNEVYNKIINKNISDITNLIRE